MSGFSPLMDGGLEISAAPAVLHEWTVAARAATESLQEVLGNGLMVASLMATITE